MSIEICSRKEFYNYKLCVISIYVAGLIHKEVYLHMSFEGLFMCYSSNINPRVQLDLKSISVETKFGKNSGNHFVKVFQKDLLKIQYVSRLIFYLLTCGISIIFNSEVLAKLILMFTRI